MSDDHDTTSRSPQPGFIKELSEDECYQRLSTTTVGRVAFVNSEGQQLLPVNFQVLGRTIFVRTAADSVLAELAEGFSDVAFGVDYHEDLYRTGWNVTAHGTTSLASTSSAAEVMSARRSQRPWAPGDRDLVIALVPDRITGRRVRGY